MHLFCYLFFSSYRHHNIGQTCPFWSTILNKMSTTTAQTVVVSCSTFLCLCDILHLVPQYANLVMCSYLLTQPLFNLYFSLPLLYALCPSHYDRAACRLIVGDLVSENFLLSNCNYVHGRGPQ